MPFQLTNLPNYSPIPGKLYAWGSAHGLPPSKTVDKAGHICYPEHVLKSIKIKQISADAGSFFSMIDEKDRLIIWGQHKSLCKLENSLKFQPVDADEKYLMASVCQYGVLAITLLDQELTYFAPDLSRTQIHTYTDLENQTRQIQKVLQIDAANSHALILLENSDQKTVVCYIDFKAQPKTKNLILQQVKNLPENEICVVAVGSHCFACLSETNDLYTWGMNINGNCGHGTRNKWISLPKKVEPKIEAKIKSIAITKGQPQPKNDMKNPTGQEGPRIHLVTEAGNLLIAGTCHKGLGCNYFGKIMTAEQDHLSFYTIGGVAQDGKQMKKHLSGESSLCLTGSFENRQLASLKNSTAPSKNSGRRIGESNLKKAGIDPNSQYFQPENFQGETKYFSNVQVTASIPSHIHSLAVANQQVYAWGCGSDGRCGVDNFFDPAKKTKRLMKCYISTPTLVEAFENQKVLAISAGRYWSFAIVAE